MQNNHDKSNPGAFRKFFQEKGYYIVLFLCVAAVGISGYIFVSSAISEKNSLNEETLSVATPATIPSGGTSTPATPSKPSGATAEAGQDTAEAAAIFDPDEAVREAAAAVRVWPISGASIADYSAEQLSYNVTTRDWRTHEGVDLSAAAGEQVKAACAGTVTAVYDDEYLGTTVVLMHADGYSTQYSNLAAMPTVNAGDSVRAGDVIGAVGATALLEIGEQPHLHFAAYQNGQCIDPSVFVGK